MSLLDLGDEKHRTEYAVQLSQGLTTHGAQLEVFRHSVDEIRDNLKASVSAAESATGYGATVRRLRSSAYTATTFLRSVQIWKAQSAGPWRAHS